jgi:hypothetical protein
VPVPSIHQHAGERRQEKRRNLSPESHDAEEKRGTGQPINEPARGDARDPRADERDALSAEE